MAGKSLGNRTRGFTLVELLIAMLAMVIVMGALVFVFISQSRMSVSEEELISLQMNLRVANERLSHAFSHAGYGCKDSFLEGSRLSGTEPNGGAIEIGGHVTNIVNGQSTATSLNPDSVIIAYGFKKIGTATSITNNVVQLAAIPSPRPDPTTNSFKRFFHFFPNFEGNYFYVLTGSANNGRQLTFSRNVDAQPRAGVYMASPVRIQISQVSKVGSFGKTIQVPTLFLKNFAYASAIHWAVAENIEDMQLQYSLDGEKWYDTVQSSDLRKIRMIRFWLLGRSERASGAGPQILEISDLKVNVPGSPCVEELGGVCVLYRVGPFADGHARMLSRGEVVLRNVH